MSPNEVDVTQRKSLTTTWHPLEAVRPELLPALASHLPEHPVAGYYQRTGDGQALKITDFVSQGQFRNLGLYEEFYKKVDVEHQIGLVLSATPSSVLAIALNRYSRDFTEPDRLILNLLRPHFLQAFRNARLFGDVQQHNAQLHLAMDQINQAAGVTLTGRLQWTTPSARRLLDAYWPESARRPAVLPAALRAWLRHLKDGLGNGRVVVEPVRPLEANRDGRRLEIRFVPDGSEAILLLKERANRLDPACLESLGLTRREAQVLAWVAGGKTNEEIGTLLGISARTVQKHLERIYQKLGVETRSSAATHALEAAGMS